MDKTLTIRDLGVTDYAECLAVQEDLWERRLTDRIANTVLLTEHKPVITLGARKSENKLLQSPTQLAEKGIAFSTTGRGGGTTAHNPGQIVVYPIVKLKTLGLGLSEYVQVLGRIGMDLLAKLGVRTIWKKKTPGLWIDNRKIASIGIQARKWVTLHGIAINISNDLSIFKAIVPCGLEDIEITSVLQETGRAPAMAEVKKILSALCQTYLCEEATVRE